MKTVSAVILGILLVPVSFRTAAQLRCVSESCAFGIINEKAGKQTRRVFVVNDGEEEDCILRVRPTCGCTAADYYKEPIAPGDSAWIDIVYNPAGRPGRINKGVRVYGADGQILTIPLTGTVIGTPETLAVSYPVDAGPLRLTEDTVVAGELRKGNARHIFVNAYNVTDRPVVPRLSCPDCADKALDLDIVPATVPPGEIATISFYINSRFEPRDGAIAYDLVLEPDTSAVPAPGAHAMQLRVALVDSTLGEQAREAAAPVSEP